jgi:hypothetical protein
VLAGWANLFCCLGSRMWCFGRRFLGHRCLSLIRRSAPVPVYLRTGTACRQDAATACRRTTDYTSGALSRQYVRCRYSGRAWHMHEDRCGQRVYAPALGPALKWFNRISSLWQPCVVVVSPSRCGDTCVCVHGKVGRAPGRHTMTCQQPEVVDAGVKW